MLVLGLADFNATREMGPILALGIVVMMACGLTLLPALLVAFGRRAFWPAIPQVEPDAAARSGAAGRGSASSSGAARALLASASRRAPRRSARSATSSGRGYLDLAEQYRDPPESVQGQELIARALTRPAASRRSTS